MKKFFEGASVITAIFFIVVVAVGFIFKVKVQKNEVRNKKNYERKIEKINKKNEAEKQSAKEKSEQEKAKIRSDAEETIRLEKEKKDACHQDDHQKLESWEIFYRKWINEKRQAQKEIELSQYLKKKDSNFFLT